MGAVSVFTQGNYPLQQYSGLSSNKFVISSKIVSVFTFRAYLGHPDPDFTRSSELHGFYAILLSSQKPRKMGDYCSL